MQLFIYIGIMIVSALIFSALLPKPPAPKPASLEDFDFPTAEEGREIPMHFGSPWVSGPNVIWYGDLAVKAIKRKPE